MLSSLGMLLRSVSDSSDDYCLVWCLLMFFHRLQIPVPHTTPQPACSVIEQLLKQ